MNGMFNRMFTENLVEQAKVFYNVPTNVYHNWKHIESMRSFLISNRFYPNDELLLAIAFHDSVYVPGAREGYNEELSALRFEKSFRSLAARVNYPFQISVEDVKNMILLSSLRFHLDDELAMKEINYRFPDTKKTDAILFLDSDLSSLAAPWDVFCRNQYNIIEEQVGILSGNDLNDAGRKAGEFLSKFLKKKNIFLANTMAYPPLETSEKTARGNIKLWCQQHGVQYD